MPLYKQGGQVIVFTCAQGHNELFEMYSHPEGRMANKRSILNLLVLHFRPFFLENVTLKMFISLKIGLLKEALT